MKIWDNLSKVLALGSSVIIFLSILKHSLFYGQFGIKFTQYVNLTELITLFLNDIIVFVIFICLIVFGVAWRKQKKKKFKENSEKRFTVKNIGCFIIPILLLAFFGAYKMFVDLYQAYKGEASLTLLWINISCLLLTLFIFFYLIVKYESFQEFALFAHYTLMWVFFIAAFAFTEAHYIKSQNPQVQYRIVQQEKELQTDNNLIFLGKTEKYLFLYNRKTQISSILKNEDIKEIHISKLE